MRLRARRPGDVRERCRSGRCGTTPGRGELLLVLFDEVAGLDGVRRRAAAAATRRPGDRASSRASCCARKRAAADDDRAVRDLDRGAEGVERGAAGDQRGAALGDRGARDQQGGAAVDQRGADHRQPRAEDQGRGDDRDQRRPAEPDQLDRHRPRCSSTAAMRIKRFTPRGGGAVQPDRRRRRPAAARHHAPARLRRPGRRTRGRVFATLHDDRARGPQHATAAGTCSRGCCRTAPPRTASTARCSPSSTSPACARAEDSVSVERGADARWSPSDARLRDPRRSTREGRIATLEPRRRGMSSATTPRRSSASRRHPVHAPRTAQRGAPAARDAHARDETGAPRTSAGSCARTAARFFCSGVMTPLHGGAPQGYAKIAATAPSRPPRRSATRARLHGGAGRRAEAMRESELKERVPGGDVARAEEPAEPDPTSTPSC